MRALAARDALHDLVLPVMANERPPFDVAWLRSRDAVFAVHEHATSEPENQFLGVVGWGNVGRFPDRIFADQLPSPRPEPVSPGSPLDEVLERLDRDCHAVLPVLDDGEFKGAVTRRSAAEALLAGGADRDLGSRTWRRTLERLHLLESFALRVDSVTHDMANMLVAVDNMAALLLARETPATTHDLTSIRVAAGHAVSLLERIREAGRSAHTPEHVLGSDLLSGLARQARLMLPQSVTLSVHLEAADAQLHLDIMDLERAVMNLVANAADAMPSGGELTLRLNRLELTVSDRDVLGRPIEARTWTRIEVRDTGHGMDDATLRSVFQPLFSTRSDRGRGMGLSTVQRMVRRNGGALRCKSAPSQGTSFELLF